ncbi:hypothetical protein WICMUC_004905 [Wickerhamomyces mucosus]|uniref:Major facilitator superfamily (MFS) profile domain-containing protein n=1 Tax=Wickerhamomyces mucosus TaxID=1378264 RepID=A0A9P8PE96_9ASCO|nr:hypothetical protein WICMUC_004905 [Wickerhamomyces mucosus]
MLFDFRYKFIESTPNVLKSKWIIFVMVAISTTLDLLNVTSLLVSTKFIAEKYNISTPIASWTLSAYAITFSGFIAFQGRVGDIIGHDNQFILNSFVFSIWSLLCGVVDKIYAYIVFRAFQGIAAAALIPSNFAIIASIFENKQLNIALTILTGVLITSTALGLIVGGAFLRINVHQHGIGYLTAAVSLSLGLMAVFNFPKLQKSKDRLKNLDYIGSLILISGLLLTVVGFTEAGESWKTPKAYVVLIVGLLLIGFFFIFENYICLKYFPKTHLLVPSSIWKIPNYLPLVFNSILNYSAYFGIMFISTSYSLNIDEVSPLIAGVRYFPFVVTMVIGVLVLTQVYGKFSQKWTSTLGFFIATLGLILFTRMDYKIHNYYWKFSFTGQILVSGGCCLYFVHYLNMIIENAPIEVQGIVSGIAQTFAQFGVALAFAVITSIVSEDVTDKDYLSKRYQYGSYFCLACFGAGTLLLTLFVHDVKPNQVKIDGSLDNSESKDEKTEGIIGRGSVSLKDIDGLV